MSVVMPTYRRPHLIGRTIKSVLSQSLSNLELLIQDDGQPGDGTEEAIAVAASGDQRVKYVRNPTSERMPGNLNAAIRRSRGEFIAVCHDHDILEPNFLEILVGLLERHPAATYAHSAITLIDQNDSPTGQTFVGDWAELTPGEEWLNFMLSSFHCPVCALTVVRRITYETQGLYNPKYGFISDVEMWMRLSMNGPVAYSREPLIRVRTRESDHDLIVNPWPTLGTTFEIHRDLLSRRFGGRTALSRRLQLEAKAELTAMRIAASQLRRGNPSTWKSAVEVMRRNGPPASRTVARVLRRGWSLVMRDTLE